jgi:hypothetical protein
MSITALTHEVTRHSSIDSSVVRRDSTDGKPLSKPAGQPRLAAGDVLVSRRTARADVYETSVVPAAPRITDTSYENGMHSGRELARTLVVDAWFTCDHIHVVRIAHHRM